MTRTELEINQEDMWRILVFEQRTTLTLAVEMLLRCQLSPEQIQDGDGTERLTPRFVRFARADYESPPHDENQKRADATANVAGATLQTTLFW